MVYPHGCESSPDGRPLQFIPWCSFTNGVARKYSLGNYVNLPSNILVDSAPEVFLSGYSDGLPFSVIVEGLSEVEQWEIASIYFLIDLDIDT
eukprot:14029713-Ditylum_brightwellii.AAC.1